MAENMMNKEHKSSNNAYREGYDGIKWEKPKKSKECPKK